MNARPTALRRRLFLSLAALAAAAAPVLAATQAQACSCMRQTSPAAFVARTGAIFEGVPSKIEVKYKRGTDGRIFWQNEAIETTIHVTRVYKGKVSKIIVLKSHVGGSLCGWQPVGVGRRQLIAAYVNKGQFRTDSCTMYPILGRAQTNPFVRYIRALPSRKPQ